MGGGEFSLVMSSGLPGVIWPASESPEGTQRA